MGVACCSSVTAVRIRSAMSRLDTVRYSWYYVTRLAFSWLIFMCPPCAPCLLLAPHPAHSVATFARRHLQLHQHGFFLIFLPPFLLFPSPNLAEQVFPPLPYQSAAKSEYNQPFEQMPQQKLILKEAWMVILSDKTLCGCIIWWALRHQWLLLKAADREQLWPFSFLNKCCSVLTKCALHKRWNM